MSDVGRERHVATYSASIWCDIVRRPDGMVRTISMPIADPFSADLDKYLPLP